MAQLADTELKTGGLLGSESVKLAIHCIYGWVVVETTIPDDMLLHGAAAKSIGVLAFLMKQFIDPPVSTSAALKASHIETLGAAMTLEVYVAVLGVLGNAAIEKKMLV